MQKIVNKLEIKVIDYKKSILVHMKISFKVLVPGSIPSRLMFFCRPRLSYLNIEWKVTKMDSNLKITALDPQILDFG